MGAVKGESGTSAFVRKKAIGGQSGCLLFSCKVLVYDIVGQKMQKCLKSVLTCNTL